LARGVECKIGAGILPRHLRAGGVRVGLVEQLPSVGAAVGDAVGFGPSQLEIGRRAGCVIGRDGAAIDRFADKQRGVATDDLPGSGNCRIVAGGETGRIKKFRSLAPKDPRQPSRGQTED